MPSLKTLSEKDFDGCAIRRESPFLRRDLYRFMNYILNNELKRTYRDNSIPKGDARKLAEILSYEKERLIVEDTGFGYWSDYISRLARAMGLAEYDVKGEYLGYSSREPIYPDNFIKPRIDEWKKYIRLTSLEKEWAILEGLNNITENEFHKSASLIDSGRFDTFGSAVNSTSQMKLAELRATLFKILSALECGTWYSLPDFVDHIKNQHPGLIINRLNRTDYTEDNIYADFYEYPLDRKGVMGTKRSEIHEKESDAFERVDGRYVTFFLEEIPFLMGFVELAYSTEIPSISPDPYDQLKAFRLTPRFSSIYGKDPSYNEVKTTVQANHEILLTYQGYAEEQMEFLSKYGKMIKDDNTIAFRIEKKKIADRVAQGEDIAGIIRELEARSSQPLPENIVAELENWGSHGEKIILYRGHCLLEIEPESGKKLRNPEKQLRSMIIKSIAPNLYLARYEIELFGFLENKEYFPQRLDHSKKAFRYTNETHSRLKCAPEKKKRKCRLSFRRFTGLECAQKDILEKVRKRIMQKNIPVFLLSEENLILVPAADGEALEDAASSVTKTLDLEIDVTDESYDAQYE